MKLSRILRKKNHWTKGCSCRNEFGEPVDLNFVPIESQKLKEFTNKIKSWSLYGAVAFYYPYPSNKRYQVMDNLKSAINKVTGKTLTVPEFNDDKNTTFEQVREVIRLSER